MSNFDILCGLSEGSQLLTTLIFFFTWAILRKKHRLKIKIFIYLVFMLVLLQSVKKIFNKKDRMNVS